MTVARAQADAPLLRLTAEAATWMLISRLFERPGEGWHASLVAMVREIADPLLGKAVGAAASARHEDHVALFGPGRTVSPREAGHVGFRDPGAMLAELHGFYRAFAFKPATDEPADHVAVEAAFVGYLFLKEAFARASEDDAAALVCAEARERFVHDHLARLGQRLAARMPSDAPGWAQFAAEALAARVAHIEIPPDAPSILVDPLASGCPMAGECAADAVESGVVRGEP